LFFAANDANERESWRGVLRAGRFVTPPPDPRLRRALGLRPKGGLRNGLLIQASLDRIPLLGLDLAAWAEGKQPSHRWESSRDHHQATKPYACEQAGLRGASSLAERRPAQLTLSGACLTGRREASRTVTLQTSPAQWKRRQPFASIRAIRGKKLPQLPSIASRCTPPEEPPPERCHLCARLSGPSECRNPTNPSTPGGTRALYWVARGDGRIR
jgi:hypothetical protein